ncbi:WD40 repeat domain-containing protein, partial [Salinispira pacifica]
MPTIPLFGQPAGRGAAAGDFELSVQVHDLFQPTCTDALLSPNGKTAFFVDQQITEIDLVTGKCLRTFGAPQQTWRSGGSFGGGVSGYEIASLSINAAALLAEGKRILAVDDELVRVWNAADGSLVAAYTISGAQGLETAAVSGDERYCIVSDNSNRLFLLDLDTGESRPIETGPVGKVGSMVCSHRGHRLLVAGSLGLFYFPDFTAVHPQSVQERFDVEDGAADGAMSVSFSDDDSLFAGTRTNRILVCDQKGDRVESIPATGVMQVRFDTDPEKLYVYSAGWNDDGSSAIVLYNRRTVEVEAEYPNLFPGYGRRFALDSAHGRLLSTNYQLWDIERNRRRDLSHYNRLSLPAIASFEPPLLKFDGVTLDLSSLAVRQTARTQRRPTDKSRTYYWDAELGLGIYEDFDFFHEFGLFVASADGQRRLGRVGPAVSHASRAALSPDGKRYAYGDLNGSIFAGGVGSGDAGLIGRSPGGTIEALSYPADNILYSGDSKGYLTEWDLTGTRPIRRAKVAEGSITAILADDESTHLYVGDTNGNLSVRDADLKKLGSIRIGTSAVSGLRLDPAGRFLFALSDSILKIVDLSTLRWTAFAATREASEWICFTDDGYWDGSANCTDLIAMVDGFDAYGVDQFAARNNRPDIILKRLGYAEQSLLDHFEHQHAKRLRRLGLSEQELSGDMRDMPEARIVASRKEGRNLFLTVRLNGRSADLSSWNLWVNDVPLFGALGRPVDGRSREVTHTVILNPGI